MGCYGELMRSRLAVGLAICVVAAAGAVAAVLVSAGGDDDSSAVATTGPYAPMKVKRQVVRMVGGGVSRGPEAGAQNNLTTNLIELPGRNRYEVTIANTSNLGAVNSFEWYPPVGCGSSRWTGPAPVGARLPA